MFFVSQCYLSLRFNDINVIDLTIVSDSLPCRALLSKGTELADAENVHPYEFFNRFLRIYIVGGAHCCRWTIAYVRTNDFAIQTFNIDNFNSSLRRSHFEMIYKDLTALFGRSVIGVNETNH